jgi:nitronate monooxygenase
MRRTRLTNLFGLDRPVVLAPLAGGATSGHLAAAVSEAGGLGLFGGIHPGGPEWIREQIRFLRSRGGPALGSRIHHVEACGLRGEFPGMP